MCTKEHLLKLRPEVTLWHSRLRTQCCHSCGAGRNCDARARSTLGPGTSTCCRCSKKKKKKKERKKKVFMVLGSLSDHLRLDLKDKFNIFLCPATITSPNTHRGLTTATTTMLSLHHQLTFPPHFLRSSYWILSLTSPRGNI